MDTATSIVGLVMIVIGLIMLLVAVVGLVRWRLQRVGEVAQERRHERTNA